MTLVIHRTFFFKDRDVDLEDLQPHEFFRLHSSAYMITDVIEGAPIARTIKHKDRPLNNNPVYEEIIETLLKNGAVFQYHTYNLHCENRGVLC